MSDTARKVTVPRLLGKRAANERIVCLTAYDYPSALLADRAGVDLILVGDSLGNVVQGRTTVLPVTLGDVAYHVSLCARATEHALLVGDMPFGSYGGSVSQAFESATQLMKAGAEAVKLEGTYLEEVAALHKAGIPVMGHLGFTPQSIHRYGGYRVQGKGDAEEEIIEAARRLEQAGVFSIVLELIPESVARRVTEAVAIPTIGIGAGIHCSGEIQVFHDILGLTDLRLKHTKRFAEGFEVMGGAIGEYARQVREGTFPGPENSV